MLSQYCLAHYISYKVRTTIQAGIYCWDTVAGTRGKWRAHLSYHSVLQGTGIQES